MTIEAAGEMRTREHFNSLRLNGTVDEIFLFLFYFNAHYRFDERSSKCKIKQNKKKWREKRDMRRALESRTTHYKPRNENKRRK